MTALVTGPNGSGKSAFAEDWAASLATPPGPLIYIATMLPYGEEGVLRVEKHKAQRRGYAFATIEAPYLVADIEIDKRSTVLLEDVSNLLSNAMFEQNGTVKSVLDDIYALSKKCSNLVMVSISGLTESDGESPETREYISGLNKINVELSLWADKTVRMREGEPHFEPYF